MKIVHLDLAGFHTENMLYQTNLLTKYNRQDGHDTTIVTTTYRWEGADIVYAPPCDRIVEDDVRLIRLPYANPIRKFQFQKFRKVCGLYKTLEMLQPDVIMCHCTQFWSILDIIIYKKRHPEVKFYADTHTAEYNSGTNWLSLHVLHRIFYRYLLQKAIPYLEKYFYVGESERKFSLAHYNVPEHLMEFYPLGGVLPSENSYKERRLRRRAELGVNEGQKLLLHTGKLDVLKRTDELLRAFSAVSELDAKLAIIGSIPKERESLLHSLIEKDDRIIYLGWKSGAELQEYLCACDLYCQPGSVSATLQNAVCCSSPIMTYPHDPYTKNLDYGNMLWVKTEDDMCQVFHDLAAGKLNLDDLRAGSARCARELLDYRALAARLYR